MIIDIERATATGRKITFSHVENGKAFFDTAFGETFKVRSRNKKVNRRELASDFSCDMLNHNLNLINQEDD